jgi:glycosyltransferase involved in cell wall biosynthesis
MTARRVSVIVPTCDRIPQLRRALESIRAVEAPDIHLQILVADNGSAPGTEGVAAEFGAVYLKVEQRGPSAARNAAMSAATGDYLAFLDDDDAWQPGHIRPHLELLEENPATDLVIGQVTSVDENHVQFGEPWLTDFPASGPDLLRRMLSGYFPQIGCILVRRRVREKVGGFDPGLTGGEDLDWLLRIAGQGPVGFVRTPCVLFTHRRIGTFDELQLTRLKFDRRVFYRHALRHWRIWRSPMEFSRAYSGTVMHFYRYFVDAALDRVERGERRAATAALWRAFRIFPLRSIKHLFHETRLRSAVAALMFPRDARTQLRQLPVWLTSFFIL